MKVLREMDPDGVQDRRHNRLTRRCYAAKVRTTESLQYDCILIPGK